MKDKHSDNPFENSIFNKGVEHFKDNKRKEMAKKMISKQKKGGQSMKKEIMEIPGGENIYSTVNSKRRNEYKNLKKNQNKND